MPYHLQPGREFPVSHFLDENGNPKTFIVTFIEGRADVEDSLAQYMLDKDIAKRSPIITSI